MSDHEAFSESAPVDTRSVRFVPRQWWAAGEGLFLLATVGLLAAALPWDELLRNLKAGLNLPIYWIALSVWLPLCAVAIALLRGAGQASAVLRIDMERRDMTGYVADSPPLHLFTLQADHVVQVGVTARPWRVRPALMLGLVERRRLGYFPSLTMAGGSRYLLHTRPFSSARGAHEAARRIAATLASLGIRLESTRGGKRSEEMPVATAEQLLDTSLPRDASRRRRAAFGIGALLALAALLFGVPEVGAALSRPADESLAWVNARGAARLILNLKGWREDLQTLANARRRHSPTSSSGEAVVQAKAAEEPARVPGDGAAPAPTAEPETTGSGALDPAEAIYYADDLVGPEITFVDALARNDQRALQGELSILLAYYQQRRQASRQAVVLLRRLIERSAKGVGPAETLLTVRCLGEVGQAGEAAVLETFLDRANRIKLPGYQKFQQVGLQRALEAAIPRMKARPAAAAPPIVESPTPPDEGGATPK